MSLYSGKRAVLTALLVQTFTLLERAKRKEKDLNTEPGIQQIRDQLELLMKLYKGRADTATAIEAVYITRARLMPPGANYVRGREEVVELWRGLYKAGEVELTVAEKRVYVYGDVGVSYNHYEFDKNDHTAAESGKALSVWIKEGGTQEWKVRNSLWNFDQPMKTQMKEF